MCLSTTLYNRGKLPVQSQVYLSPHSTGPQHQVISTFWFIKTLNLPTWFVHWKKYSLREGKIILAKNRYYKGVFTMFLETWQFIKKCLIIPPFRRVDMHFLFIGTLWFACVKGIWSKTIRNGTLFSIYTDVFPSVDNL